MCGIAGIFSRGPVDEQIVARLIGPIAHRGPDDQGIWIDRDAGIGLGHRRLSILDLSPAGHQPMLTADGRFSCSLIGEIYNYVGLRAELAQRGYAFKTGTDTEVLLAAFSCWGTAAIGKFRGQFAVAIWDASHRRLLLAR